MYSAGVSGRLTAALCCGNQFATSPHLYMQYLTACLIRKLTQMYKYIAAWGHNRFLNTLSASNTPTHPMLHLPKSVYKIVFTFLNYGEHSKNLNNSWELQLHYRVKFRPPWAVETLSVTNLSAYISVVSSMYHSGVRWEMHIKFWCGTFKWRYHIKTLSLYMMIILDWMLNIGCGIVSYIGLCKQWRLVCSRWWSLGFHKRSLISVALVPL
jgi:hypothetical protein